MRHKHADLIKQWAEDTTKIIECKNNLGHWVKVATPMWNPLFEYRLVDPQKKKVEMWQWIMKWNRGHPHLTNGFYKSEHEVIENFPTLEIVQRADWTRIEVEE